METTQPTPADVRERLEELLDVLVTAAQRYGAAHGTDYVPCMEGVELGKARRAVVEFALLRTPRGEGEDTIPVSALRSEIAQLRSHRLLPYLAWARLCALAGGEPVGEDTPAALRSEAQGEG